VRESGRFAAGTARVLGRLRGGSRRAGAVAERRGGDDAQVAAFRDSSLLQVVERVGVDGDVQTYLRTLRGPLGAQRRGFVE
jgi:hypothetical protein